MATRAALLAVLCSCSMTSAQRVSAVAAFTSLACDYGQTMWHAREGWTQVYETNAIMGQTPSPTDVTTYFGSVVFVVALVQLLAPSWASTGANVATLSVESDAILGNARFTPTCGI